MVQMLSKVVRFLCVLMLQVHGDLCLNRFIWLLNWQIKVQVQDGSGLDSHEAADVLAERLGAEVVQVIGNRCVLYRRSKRDDVEHIRLVRE